MRLPTIIVLAILLFLPFSAEAVGDAPTELSVTPSIYEMIVNPGESKIETFELANQSTIPVPIKSYIRTFDASDEVGGVQISEDPDTARLSPTSWSRILGPDFIIRPGQTKRVEVEFNPPRDLPPGGYYSILFFESLLPESFLSDQNLEVNGRIGALLFIIGSGDINEKGGLVSFEGKKYNFRQPIELAASFRNSGNVHLRPSGKIEAKNLFGKLVKTIEIPEVTVLPNKSRQFKTDLNSLRWPGYYQISLQLIYGRDKIQVGKSLNFFYLPLVSVVVAAAIIVFVAMLLSPKERRRLRRALRILERGK